MIDFSEEEGNSFIGFKAGFVFATPSIGGQALRRTGSQKEIIKLDNNLWIASSLSPMAKKLQNTIGL
jgi:hypothetical protein